MSKAPPKRVFEHAALFSFQIPPTTWKNIEDHLGPIPAEYRHCFERPLARLHAAASAPKAQSTNAAALKIAAELAEMHQLMSSAEGRAVYRSGDTADATIEPFLALMSLLSGRAQLYADRANFETGRAQPEGYAPFEEFVRSVADGYLAIKGSWPNPAIGKNEPKLNPTNRKDGSGRKPNDFAVLIRCLYEALPDTSKPYRTPTIYQKLRNILEEYCGNSNNVANKVRPALIDGALPPETV